MAIDLRWQDDFCRATLLGDGSFLGVLSIEAWWTKPEGDREAAWVAGYYDAGEDAYVKVCVEVPAKPVDESRKAAMLEKTRAAIASGPQLPPAAEAPPVPPKLSAEEVSEQLDRVISGWDSALEDLARLAERRDPKLAETLYMELMHVLNWAYTADQALQAAWNQVPTALKGPASKDADRKIAEAIADWQSHKPPGWKPADEAVFRPYLDRHLPGQGRPYKDWASVMVAGDFHEEFFAGLAWVSGKLRHQAVALPIELRQMEPGGEPRWKWKLAEGVVVPERNTEKHSRAAYVEHLQERDVVGLFSWLVDVFVDAEHLLVKLLLDAETSA